MGERDFPQPPTLRHGEELPGLGRIPPDLLEDLLLQDEGRGGRGGLPAVLDQTPPTSELQNGQETAGRHLVVGDSQLSLTAQVILQWSDPGLEGEDEGAAPAPVAASLLSLLLPGPLQPGLAVGLQVFTDALTPSDGGEPAWYRVNHSTPDSRAQIVICCF